MNVPERDPVVCLVTDRRRAYVGADLDGAVDCLVAQATLAADAGVDMIQVREVDLDARALAAVVSRLIAAVRGSRTKIVVNERTDVAIGTGADGVHLRGNSVRPEAVRSIAPAPFLIGCSIRSTADATSSAPGADYLIAGTVYETASKPEQTTYLGAGGLAAICNAVAVPVLAIGGITIDRLHDIARSGAAGIAGISIFLDAGEGACRARPMRELIADLRRAWRVAVR